MGELASADMEENADVATKRAKLQDGERNRFMRIQHSRSPIEGCADTAYRERSSDFDPETPFGDQHREIPARRTLQDIAFVIYELNKFPCAATIQNAKEFEKQISATTSTDCNLRRTIIIGPPSIIELLLNR